MIFKDNSIYKFDNGWRTGLAQILFYDKISKGYLCRILEDDPHPTVVPLTVTDMARFKDILHQNQLNLTSKRIIELKEQHKEKQFPILWLCDTDLLYLDIPLKHIEELLGELEWQTSNTK